MSEPLKISNRRLWMHKGVVSPNFRAEHVLSQDPWLYVELWLTRKKAYSSLSFWRQARRFADAAVSMPIEAAPLPLYYAFLNATKALLTYKNCSHGKNHGVSGERPSDARASLANELVKFRGGGVLPDFCRYFGESATNEEYSLSEILWNIPFIHRAYRLTFTTKAELFIPLERAIYVKKKESAEAYFEAKVLPRYADKRKLATIPRSFEYYESDDGFSIRRRKSFRWVSGRSSKKKLDAAHSRLEHYHAQTRRVVVNISGNRDLWYLKKTIESNRAGSRHTALLMFAAMHRLSELSRYDPAGLDRHLAGQANWLLSEFISGAMDQFLDQVATEITGCQFWPPKVR